MQDFLAFPDPQMVACGNSVDKQWKPHAYALNGAFATSIMACYDGTASPSFNWWAELMSQVKWTRHHKRIGVQPYEPRKLTLTEMTWHVQDKQKGPMTMDPMCFPI